MTISKIYGTVMIKILLSFVCLWSVCIVAFACEAVSISSKGSLKLGELTLAATCYEAVSWKAVSQEDSRFRIVNRSGEAANFQMSGSFVLPGLPENSFEESVGRNSSGIWNYQAKIRFCSPAKLAQVGLASRLPVGTFCGRRLLADGREIVLPEEYRQENTHTIFNKQVSEVILPLTNCRIILRGNFGLLLQDDRAFGHDNYTLRLLFFPARGKMTKSVIKIEIETAPYHSAPLDLSRAVNMGFSDETEGDGRGGWTDQGPENDLHMMPTGMQCWNGVNFRIINPAENCNRSCIVLSARPGSLFPAAASAEQPEPVHGRWLYLLHALAWPDAGHTVGTVILTYIDGTYTEIPIVGNVDVGNWWEPKSYRNCSVVWAAEHKRACIGLYRSAHRVEEKPVRHISFRASGKSVWGIVAASLCSDRIPEVSHVPIIIAAGREWQPVRYSKDFRKGSVLDFSSRLDAPAGKYGPLTVQGDRFVFRDRPEVPVRFYGANLCKTAQYLNREWAERLADRFAAQGYNAVRIHHHDNDLVLHRNGSSTELDQKNAEQLDYLLACFKKRGIYFTTDLYVSRTTERGEIPEFPQKRFSNKTFKPLIFVLDSAMENWKSFARNWLTHVNPHTGLALKDEPALLSLSLVNEDNLISCWDSTPESTRLYLNRFDQWKRDRGVTGGRAQAGDVLFSQFLVETYRRGYDEMLQFVRKLGVQVPLSDQNMATQVQLASMRNRYDFVENHFYWSHPAFPETRWRLPSEAVNTSALNREARMPAQLFPSRLLDKPMMITEFDFAAPNSFRAEGAVLTGAYAALQDWNGLFQFAYAHRREKVMRDDVADGYFDTSVDVVKSLSQRIGLRLFLDRELKPAPVVFAALLKDGNELSFSDKYPDELLRLGLIAKIGTLIRPDAASILLPEGLAGLLNLGKGFPGKTPGTFPVFRADDRKLLDRMTASGMLKPEWHDGKKRVFHASNGQIVLDSDKKTFHVRTPSCEVWILPPGEKGDGVFLRVDNRIGHGVFAVMSVDCRTLTDSSRILLLHLTDSHGSGIQFGNSRMTRLERWGKTPLLAARGEARIKLNTAPGNAYALYAVDTAGERVAEVPFSRSASGSLSFPARIFTSDGVVFAYELVKK